MLPCAGSLQEPSTSTGKPRPFGTGIIVTHTTTHNPLDPPEALTDLCKQQLELQLQHSEVVGADGGVPLWRLKCSREGQLQGLCGRMRQLCTSAAEQVRQHASLQG